MSGYFRRSRLDPRRSVVAKFLLVVIPVVALFATVFSAVLVQAIHEELDHQLTHRVGHMADAAAVALGEPLAESQEAAAQAIVDSFYAFDEFVCAEAIASSSGARFSWPKAGCFDAAPAGNRLVREVSYEEQNVGRLTVVYDHASIHDAVDDNVVKGVSLFLALCGVTVAASLLAYRVIVGIPLRRLLQAVRGAESGELQIVAEEPSRDELGAVIRSYNALAQRMGARTRDLEAAHREAERALAETREAQRQLVEAEKMAALGSLVAGVAHEINTPVGIALTTTTFLEDETRAFAKRFASGEMRKSDLERYIETSLDSTTLMLSNIQRAAELIHSFKQVAVDQTSAERRRFDLREYLDEILVSLTPRLRHAAATVTIDCPPDLEIDSYPGGLSQIVTNLIMNSLLHAYGEGESGHIRICASEVEPGWIDLVYEDDGCGIPRANLGRIFEPFFTTRRGSGGTGLGLHIVFNIARRSLGGTIRADSIEGEGASFSLRFPRAAPVIVEG